MLLRVNTPAPVTIAEALLGEDPAKWLLTFTTKASASS
jgi:hypothetical protein